MDQLRTRFPDCSDDELCFGTRAARGSEVLHSIEHNAKTASIVNYSDTNEDIGESYGEVSLFGKVRSDIYLRIEKFKTVMPTNILKIPPSENELLFSAFDDRLYGSFFTLIDKTNDFDFVQIFDVLGTIGK